MAFGYAYAAGAKKKKKGKRKKKAKPKIVVNVCTMTGKVVFEAQGELTVSTVKQKIFEKHGIAVEDQKFLHRGEELPPSVETEPIEKFNPVIMVNLGRHFLENWEVDQDARFSGYFGYS